MLSSPVFLPQVLLSPAQGSDSNSSSPFPLECYTGKEDLTVFLYDVDVQRETIMTSSKTKENGNKSVSWPKCEFVIFSIHFLSLFASFIFFQKVFLKEFSINPLAVYKGTGLSDNCLILFHFPRKSQCVGSHCKVISL